MSERGANHGRCTATTIGRAARAAPRHVGGVAGAGERARGRSSTTRGAALTERMLELAGLAPGERVLELACGAGRARAGGRRLVGPDGEVVLSDVAPEMTAIAAARADALGLRQRDHARARPRADRRARRLYDVVLCREGLMLVPDPGAGRARDPARAAAGRPRRARGLGAPRQRNPWLGVVFDAVSGTARRARPAAGPAAARSRSTTPIGSPRVLTDAGLTDVAVEEFADAVPRSVDRRVVAADVPRSPARSPRGSPSCRLRRRVPSTTGPRPRSRATRRLLGWRSPASAWSRQR